jgi:hypothetical protein
VHPIGGVHARPPRLTVQDCVSVRMPAPLHVPPLHVGVVHVRLWLPVALQLDGSARMHTPNEPQVSAPHVRPSVGRVHGSVSTRMRVPHAPPMQTGTVTVRVRVLVASHVSEKGPQRLHGSGISAPQALPFVSRLQPAVSISTSVIEPHVPAEHAWVVWEREREPVGLHEST